MVWPGAAPALWRIFIIFGFVCGCAAMTAKAADMNEANARYAEGDFAEAERLYHAALKRTPNDARILERLGTLALWKNDLAGAESYLMAAMRHASWTNKLWPWNAQIKWRLALVHARAGRMQEASALLGEAAGPLPLGSLKEIKIRSRQLALFAQDAPYVIEGPDEASLPFVITDPLPVVKVSVNGSAPVDFFIDTGGEGVILDAAFATETGAVIAGAAPAEYAGGKKGMTGYGKIASIKLGEILVKHVPVSTLDLRPVASSVFNGRGIKGIIGTNLLMRFLATMDYRAQRLTLRRAGGNTQNVLDRIGASAAGNRHIPMWLVETHLIFAQGSVNALPPRLMLIDTGLAGGGFLASKAIFAAAGVAMDWGKSGMGAGGGGITKALNVRVDTVTLGAGDSAITKKDLNGLVFEDDMSLFTGALGFEAGGLVSHQFFRDGALTFDFQNMELIVQR